LKVKKYIYTVLLLLCVSGWSVGQLPANRTVETRIADLLAQVPGKDQKSIERNAAEVAALGKSGIAQLVGRLSAPEKAQNAAIEYAIGGFTYFVNQPGREEWRKLAASGYAEALPKLTNKVNQAFVLFQLQQVDKGEGTSAIIPFLEDAELVGPAARALAAGGTQQGANAMVKALENPWGNRQLHLIEALGEMNFAGAAGVIERFAASEEQQIRKVSQFALANIASPSSEPVLRKAAEKAGLIYDESNATGNYLQYLTRLGEKGDKELVAKSAQALYAKASTARQSHTKAAALSILASVKGQAAVGELVKAAQSPDGKLRGTALASLQKFSGPATTLALTKLLTTGNAAVKSDVISFLGNAGGAAAIPAITKGLTDKSSLVKVASVAALSKLGGESSVSKLLPLLKGNDALVIGAVKTALLGTKSNSLIDQVASAIPSASDAGKVALLDVLAGRRAENKLGVVSGLLTSNSPAVKAAAFSALSGVVSGKDLPQLLGLLNTVKDGANISAVQNALKSAIKSESNPSQLVGQLLGTMNQSSNKAAYLPVLASVGGAQALSATISSFNSGSDAEKAASLKALSEWSDDSSLGELYTIAKNTNNGTYKDQAIAAYVANVRRSSVNPVQKVILLRNVLEVAASTDSKKEILAELQKNKTFLSLITVGKYLDDAALQQTAAQAVMSIAMSNTQFDGAIVRGLLTKTMQVIQGPDSEYQKEAIKKHLTEILPDDKGFVSLFNGKDLTGWKGLVDNPIKRAKLSADSLAYKQKIADATMRSGWVVEDGVLVFTGKGQNIVAQKEYGDLEMYVDWKLDKHGKEGDAGIYLRGSPQVQIWDTSRVKVGAQVGSGGLYNNKIHKSTPDKVADNPLGEWNTFYIKMVGDRVTVDLNGERVVDNVILENLWDRSIPIFPVGQLELQAHGTKVYYRDIYVKELPRVEPFQLSEQEKKDGFKVLFDGTNMHEWQGNTDDYFIENGELVVKPRGGNKPGTRNLYTKDEYSDFIFRFEFKLTPGANNGLGVRAPLTGDAAYSGAAEIQILDDTAPIYAKLEPYQYHGSVYGIIPAKTGFLKPVGEWNYEEVYMKGSKIKVVLNGTTIVDGDLVEATKNGTADKKEHPGLHNKSGHIAFLGHGNELYFRNIRIKDLSVKEEVAPVAEPATGKKAKKEKKEKKKKK
jgi:HEAT repeat protein